MIKFELLVTEEKPRGTCSGPEVDYGCWWRYQNNRWRVSWNTNSGVLYAVSLTGPKQYIRLGLFISRKQADERMQGWEKNQPKDLEEFLQA